MVWRFQDIQRDRGSSRKKELRKIYGLFGLRKERERGGHWSRSLITQVFTPIYDYQVLFNNSISYYINIILKSVDLYREFIRNFNYIFIYY